MVKLLEQAMPDTEAASTAIGKNAYNTIYEYFFGDYDPALDGIVIQPSALNDLTQSFFLGVEDFQIQTVIDLLAAPVSNPSNTFQDILDFLSTHSFDLANSIAELVANLFSSATLATAPVRRDPLVLDLDNDGLETTGVSATNPIYFDHDADGVKTATGWVSADDAFLVLDKNANGKIDTGRELFGDAFVKSNGQLAADGFDALRDLDSNADGKIDANDAQFANLRLWRDLNQDGVSQSNELFTLASQNIAAINVASTEHSQILANGNQLADIGSFVKTDGSSGTLGEVSGNLGDINLVQDTFHSQFTDTLDTTGFETLPDMQGAGQVRDLREAANDKVWRIAA